MNIGVYGGSFNPPHMGHRLIIEQLIDDRVLDRVYIVPTGRNYIKQGLEKFHHRKEMLKLAFEDMQSVEIVDIEDKDTQIFTYMTLDYFRERYPNDNIYFIMGSDNLLQLHTWKNYQYMIDNYSFIIVVRNGDDMSMLSECAKRGNFTFINEVSTLSSSNIRNSIYKSENIKDFVHREVYDYIVNNNLYK